MGSRARRNGLLGAALVVAAAVAGLVHALTRGGPGERSGVPARADAARDAAPAPGPAAARTAGPLIKPAILRAAPARDAGDEDESAATAPVPPEQMRGARGALERVARPCFDAARRKDPAIFPLIRFRYTLIIERGEARASDIRLEREDIGGEELPACLTKAMSSARWKMDAPDARVQIADGFAFEGSLDEAPTP